jgi:hypothetical protein
MFFIFLDMYVEECMSNYIRKPLEKRNFFSDDVITYKGFFELNTEYYDYDEKYKYNRFKLFNKSDENNEGVSISSPMLKIKILPPIGYNGKRDIQILDENDNILDNNKMIVERVEIYDDKGVMEIGRIASRLIRRKDGRIGGRKASVKKEVCGKLRCIYKIPGSRKEHLKYKGQLITVADYKKLMKAKSI